MSSSSLQMQIQENGYHIYAFHQMAMEGLPIDVLKISVRQQKGMTFEITIPTLICSSIRGLYPFSPAHFSLCRKIQEILISL